MAHTHSTDIRELATEEFDAFLSDDIDLGDESQLRRLEDIVAELCGDRRGVHVHILSAEQWQSALLRAGVRAGRRADHHKVLPDTRDQGALLVGPPALAGLNNLSRPVTAEVVYALLSAGAPRLPEVFAKGAHDLLAAEVARRIGVDFLSAFAPLEARFVELLIVALQAEWGYQTLDWLAEVKVHPERFLLAVRRSKFATSWLSAAKNEPYIAPRLAKAPQKHIWLTEKLFDPRRRMDDRFMQMTLKALEEYRDALNAA